MDDVVILSAVRTPIGAFQGALAGLPAHALGARAIAAAIERAGLTPEEIQAAAPIFHDSFRQAERAGYDAVVPLGMLDIGVDGGRSAVDIPVIGLLRTSMHAALTLADKVGITVPLAPHVPYTWRILRSHGLDRFVSDIRSQGMNDDMTICVVMA